VPNFYRGLLTLFIPVAQLAPSQENKAYSLPCVFLLSPGNGKWEFSCTGKVHVTLRKAQINHHTSV